MENSDKVLFQLEQILGRMAQKAQEMGLPGTAVAGVVDASKSLTSRSRDCGKVFNDKCNYLAIAHGKIGEMADTGKESGSKVRGALLGELGYVGGSLKVSSEVTWVAAYSGAKGEEDLAISRHGLEII